MPYVSAWVMLLEAVEHVRRVEQSSADDAYRDLFKALCDGGVRSRRLGDDRLVPSTFWWGATLFDDGCVIHGYRHQAHPAHLQPPSFHYEVRRGDLLKWWPLPAEPGNIRSPQMGTVVPHAEECISVSSPTGLPPEGRGAISTEDELGVAPRVFVSYSHDTPSHCDRVLVLARRLRDEGVNAIIDKNEQSPPQGWPSWCEEQIRKARFVLMVCTETYLLRVNNTEEPHQGHGVPWEARLIRQHLYDQGSVSDKFVPVLFVGGLPSHVPTPVKGATIYRVDTSEGYEALYRLLTNQPSAPLTPLGPRKLLPPRQWIGHPAEHRDDPLQLLDAIKQWSPEIARRLDQAKWCSADEIRIIAQQLERRRKLYDHPSRMRNRGRDRGAGLGSVTASAADDADDLAGSEFPNLLRDDLGRLLREWDQWDDKDRLVCASELAGRLIIEKTRREQPYILKYAPPPVPRAELSADYVPVGEARHDELGWSDFDLRSSMIRRGGGNWLPVRIFRR